MIYLNSSMEQLPERLGIEVPTTRAIIDVLSVLTDYDYRQNGVKLADLGISQFATRQEILEYLNGE